MAGPEEENNDLPLDMEKYTQYGPDQSKHYLELNSAELSMLKKAEETFEHVIILINSSHVMELGFLDDENVDAAVWIGGIGDVGSLSVAGVLSGRIDPSRPDSGYIPVSDGICSVVLQFRRVCLYEFCGLF